MKHFKNVWDAFRSRLPATKQDLEKIEKTIMAIQADIEELVTAASALSTASDLVSVKLDKLIADDERLIAALQNVTNLPPEAVTALAAVKASIVTAGAAGDKVDAEVAKLDQVLPTPAPPAPTP